MLTICVDYDGTFTADVKLMRSFINIAMESGHRVVCITGRRESFENRRELEHAFPKGVEIFFAYDEPKRQHAERHGLAVDIWMDDIPEMIAGAQ